MNGDMVLAGSLPSCSDVPIVWNSWVGWLKSLAESRDECAGEHERLSKAMNYRFLQKGPKALIFKGTFTARGRKPDNGWRDQSVKERVRKHRMRNPIKKNGQKKKRGRQH